VESFSTDDIHISGDEKDKAFERARRYFGLAEGYIGKEK
jgi:aminoglycoside phosphotransferase family enzyme